MRKEIDEVPSIGENLVDYVLFSKLIDTYGLLFDETKNSICNAIANLSPEVIKEVISNVPIDWNLGNKEKNEIFNFINTRKVIVENHFNILLKDIGL